MCVYIYIYIYIYTHILYLASCESITEITPAGPLSEMSGKSGCQASHDDFQTPRHVSRTRKT